MYHDRPLAGTIVGVVERDISSDRGFELALGDDFCGQGALKAFGVVGLPRIFWELCKGEEVEEVVL